MFRRLPVSSLKQTSMIDKLINACIQSDASCPKLPQLEGIISTETNYSGCLHDFNGRTPLHFLATRCNQEGFDYLLKAMPTLDINQKDDMKWTALSNACYLGNQAMIEYLLNKMAETEVIDFGGKNLLHLIAGNINLSRASKLKVIQLLAQFIHSDALDERGNDYQTIMDFDMNSDLKSVGVDPFGRSVLHWAGYSFEMYQSIYHSYVHLIDATDDVGRTALFYAVHNRNPNLNYITWLIENGLDVNHCDKGNKTPLHFAAHAGHEGTLKCLLEAGANPFLEDSMQQTSIAIAERYSQDNVPILQNYV